LLGKYSLEKKNNLEILHNVLRAKITLWTKKISRKYFLKITDPLAKNKK